MRGVDDAWVAGLSTCVGNDELPITLTVDLIYIGDEPLDANRDR
jgi:hypothetical protein